MSSNLADYFRVQADWRDGRAEQYPDDERNAQCAAALRSLAEYVELIEPTSGEVGSPSGKRTLSYVHELHAHLQDGALGGAHTRREVSRYGYGHAVGSHEQFLEDLVPLCNEDAYEHAVEHDGDDPTGALHRFEFEAARDGIYIQRSYWRRRETSPVCQLEECVREARAVDRDSGEGLPDMGESLHLAGAGG